MKKNANKLGKSQLRSEFSPDFEKTSKRTFSEAKPFRFFVRFQDCIFPNP